MHATTEIMPVSWRRTAIWCGLGLLASVGIGLLAALLPARARLLGLFGVGEGVLVGVALAELVSRLRMARPRFLELPSFLCGLAAFTVTTLIWWQSLSSDLFQKYPPPPTNMLTLQLRAKNPLPTGNGATPQSQEFDREAADMQAAHKAELSSRRSFSGYLVFRSAGFLSAQGITERQASGWAKWLGELVAAGIAASVMAHRGTQRADVEQAASLPLRTS